MTEAMANELFRQKYPDGTIRRKNSTSAGYRYFVTFTGGESKVYEFIGDSYADMLGKVGIKVVYKDNAFAIREAIRRTESEIERGGYEDVFFGGCFVRFDDDEIAAKHAYIAGLKEQLADAVIV